MKELLIGIAVYMLVWTVSVFTVLGGTIAVMYLFRDNPSFNLEMGWMAVILLAPPILGSVLAIPLAVYFVKKLNRKSGSADPAGEKMPGAE